MVVVRDGIVFLFLFFFNTLKSKLGLLSLWRCRQRLFENLRMLPHAPGVQMQAIPEDAVPDDNVDEDAEDPDKRLSSTTLTRTKSALKSTPNILPF